MEQRRKIVIAFSTALGITLLAAWFFYSKIPHTHELMVVPEVVLLLALVLPILAAQTLVPARAALISGIGSCVVWVAGIIASFVIKPGSNVIYIPDALLLLGFVPLFYHWRFSWPWFVFGAFNFGIGVFLQAIRYIDDGLFPPPLVVAKHHLSEYHPSITWWIIGLLAIMFGSCRLSKNLWKRCRR
ncbi:MAG TPA: hypothetical protein V6D22_14250 [Candidatus Obscuribacterales bacterium]